MDYFIRNSDRAMPKEDEIFQKSRKNAAEEPQFGGKKGSWYYLFR